MRIKIQFRAYSYHIFNFISIYLHLFLNLFKIIEFGGNILKQFMANNENLSQFGFKGVIENSIYGIEQLEALKRQSKLDFTAFNLYKNPVNDLINKVLYPREKVLEILKAPGEVILSSKAALVIGYGNLGKSIAKTLSGNYLLVYVSEKDPTIALKAGIDG